MQFIILSDSHQSHSQSADMGRGARGGRGRGRAMRRGRGRGSYHRTKFDQDFDFESSNAKFNKEEVERELLTSLKKNLSMKDEDDVCEIDRIFFSFLNV